MKELGFGKEVELEEFKEAEEGIWTGTFSYPFGDGGKMNIFEYILNHFSDLLSTQQRDDIVKNKNKFLANIKSLLNHPVDALKKLDQIKCQRVNTLTNGYIPGGPNKTFDFLFDFVLPNHCSIRSKFEAPPAASVGGQCWQSYGSDLVGNYNTSSWKDDKMKCYICDVELEPPSGAGPKSMQCEHLFPFTEGILFWFLLLNSSKQNGDSGPDWTPAFKEMAKREYAPVCRKCNCSGFKLSLGILKFNEAWFTNSDETNIVTLDDNSLQKISGKNYPVQDPHEPQSPPLPSRDERYNRLLYIFNPLKDVINKRLREIIVEGPGSNPHQKVLIYLISRYMMYFDGPVIGKLMKVITTGENLVKKDKKRRKSNMLFGKMAKKAYDKFSAIAQQLGIVSKAVARADSVAGKDSAAAQGSKSARARSAKQKLAAASGKKAKQMRSIQKVIKNRAKELKKKVAGVFKIFGLDKEKDIKDFATHFKTEGVDYAKLYSLTNEDEKKITEELVEIGIDFKELKQDVDEAVLTGGGQFVSRLRASRPQYTHIHPSLIVFLLYLWKVADKKIKKIGDDAIHQTIIQFFEKLNETMESDNQQRIYEIDDIARNLCEEESGTRESKSETLVREEKGEAGPICNSGCPEDCEENDSVMDYLEKLKIQLRKDKDPECKKLAEEGNRRM